jgi:aminoglycoside phosphotransferase (APT) family kinase protein
LEGQAAVTTDFTSRVTHFARQKLGGNHDVEHLHRLTGGANMESWSFDYDSQGYVLRYSPFAELMAGRPFGHDIEAMVVRTAFDAGVRAPEIIDEIEAADGLGTGFLMRRVEAEVNPAKILAHPPRSLLADLAQEMAAIHEIPVQKLPALPSPDTATLLADLKAKFSEYGGDRPVMALAFRWLQDHLPSQVEPVFLHGDFRMGNIMVGPHGLAAVLDWELAHLGDRHQDLAYGCINSWRFGQIDRPAFGVGTLAEYWSAYEKRSGVQVESDRFRWWQVYSTLWWGICCLQMAEIWRSGLDSGLERAVIGRRASETEVDLLLLLEEDAPERERGPIALPESSEPRRLGEPSTTEMLEAIRAWIEAEIKAKAQGRDRFMASVAMNALGMLQRDAARPVQIHHKQFADDLLAGRQTLATPGLLAQLKAQSLAKLAADQPNYSALAAATKKWSA